MMHAIYVRKYEDSIIGPKEFLAIEIPDERTARDIVSRIACSYPSHGRFHLTRTYWFQNQRGRYEIGCEEDDPSFVYGAQARELSRERRSA